MNAVKKILLRIESASNKSLIGIISVFGLITYGNSLLNGFVYDDFNYIINNPQVHSINIGVLFGKNLFNMAGQYRPISATYLALLYSLFGNSAFPYHFLQIIMHVGIVVLLFSLFQKFFGKTLSLALSSIFLVHRMNVEAISYIASAQDPLFNLFGLGALLLYIKKPYGKSIILVFILLLLSLLTKEEGIVYVFLIIFYFALFNRQKIAKLSITGVSVIVVYAAIRIFFGQVYFTTRILAPIASINLPERALNIPIIIFHYLKTFIFPMTLAVDQQWVIRSISFNTLYFPLIIEVLFSSIILYLGVYLFKRDKDRFYVFIFFLFWFLLGLAPHLQVFPLDFTVTDRWFYFPMIGLLGLLGVAYVSLTNKIKIPIATTLVITLTVILLFAIRTIARNSDWKNNITLFSHDIQIEDNYDIEIFLGNEYLNAGNFGKAFYYLSKSVSSKPNELNLHNLGVAYERSGDLEKAREYYYKALHAYDYKLFDSHIHDLSSYNSYASFLVFFDDPKKAEEFINEGLKDYPNADTLWFFLSLARYKERDKQGALTAAIKAQSLNPNQENIFLYSHLVNNQPITITVYGKTFNF